MLKEYQNIDIKLDKKEDVIEGYTIYDKSRYVFTERELGQNIRMQNCLDIFGNGDEPAEIDTESKQFKLEIQKLIKEAFQTPYLKPPKQEGSLSENIMSKRLMDILPAITASEKYLFLDRYIPKAKREKILREAVQKAFAIVRDRLYELETNKEKETLESKFRLIGKVLENGIFDVGSKNGSVRLLFRSLGVKYHNNRCPLPIRTGIRFLFAWASCPFQRPWKNMYPPVLSAKII